MSGSEEGRRRESKVEDSREKERGKGREQRKEGWEACVILCVVSVSIVHALCSSFSFYPSPISRARKIGWRRRRGQYSRQWTWPGLSGGRNFWQRARQVLRRLWPRHNKPGRHGQCIT